MSFFKIAAKNLGRKKSRTILTVVAIALGTALLAGIVILNDSYLDSYINGVSEQLGYTDLGFKRHLNVSDGYFTINDFKNQTNIEDSEGYISSTGRIVNKHICTNFEGISEKYAYETTFFGIDLEGDIGYGYAEILATTTQVQNQLSKEPDTIDMLLLLLGLKMCIIFN
jgi:ABC-type antimicrobial peptide transport system permease subunit